MMFCYSLNAYTGYTLLGIDYSGFESNTSEDCGESRDRHQNDTEHEQAKETGVMSHPNIPLQSIPHIAAVYH